MIKYKQYYDSIGIGLTVDLLWLVFSRKQNVVVGTKMFHIRKQLVSKDCKMCGISLMVNRIN